MGNCACAPRNSLELKLNEIWSESDITKISPESYYSFFKRFVEAEKDITNVEEQEQQIYSTILTSQNNKNFYANLKNDLVFMGNNGKLHLIMLALIFFTKASNGNVLSRFLERLYSFVKFYFNVKFEIQTDKDFFAEILDTFVLICSQLSLKYIDTPSIYIGDKENEFDLLKKFYEKKYRDMLIKKLLDEEEFFFMNKFVQDNFEKLSHSAIRDELSIIYNENNK